MANTARAYEPTTETNKKPVIFKYTVYHRTNKRTETRMWGTNKSGAAEPIRDRNTVNKILEYFLTYDNGTSQKSFGMRNFALMMFAFNIGRRAGDILKLTIGDVYEPAVRKIKESLIIKEEKTGKSKKLHLNEPLRKSLMRYIEKERQNAPLSEPLFASRQRDANGRRKAITIQQFWGLMKQMQQALGIDGKISTHTCRKTFARQILEAHPNNPEVLALIQELLNHSSISTTRRYLDLTDDAQRELFTSLNLGIDLVDD